MNLLNSNYFICKNDCNQAKYFFNFLKHFLSDNIIKVMYAEKRLERKLEEIYQKSNELKDFIKETFHKNNLGEINVLDKKLIVE